MRTGPIGRIASTVDVALDPIGQLAENAKLRCNGKDWKEALDAARSVVEEARTGLPPGAGGRERVAVLVALRMIQSWMSGQR